MIAYHYTTAKAWKKIQRSGLRPYWIDLTYAQKDCRDIPPFVKGVWLYTNPQSPLSHLGCLVWQYARKGDANLVLLKIDAQLIHHPALYTREGYLIDLHHTATINAERDQGDVLVTRKLHSSEPVFIANCTIPPSCITKLGEWNLVDLVRISA